MSTKQPLQGGTRQRFAGFGLRPVMVALVLAGGIRALVTSLRNPLAALAAHAINLLIDRSRAQVLLLDIPYFSWLAVIGSAMSGILLLGLGLWLGWWRYARQNSVTPWLR
jgi:hypothetical protein